MKNLIEIEDGVYATDRCYLCKKGEPQIKNVKRVSKDGTIRYYMICRDCNNKKMRDYYKNNKEKVRQIVYKSIEKHKAKHLCRMKSHYLVKKGVITKPKECECCNKKGEVNMHHINYKKPEMIEWLCTSCHADRHLEHRTAYEKK